MASVSPAATGMGWIRFGHLSPDTPPVDVCVCSFGSSGAQIGLPKVGYGDASPYEAVSAGEYSIAIRAAGASASSQPVMSTRVTVIAGCAYTVAAMGPESGLRLQVLEDQLTTQPGEAAVRIIQASLKQQTVSKVSRGGRVVARRVAFATVVDYQPIPPGIWTIVAHTPTGTAQQHVPLYPGTVDTLVILDGAHGLEIRVLQDAEGQRARELLEAGDVGVARAVTEEALRASPNRPELLWLAADVEFADGDQQAGMCWLAKAADASGRDAAAISRQIRALSENQLWRTTLITVEQVPAKVRDDPLVRAAIGDFYKTLYCHGHAVGGYGSSSGLEPSTRKRRRLSWLRSGGPFTFARDRIDTWEDEHLLSVLREDQPTAYAQLDAVPDLDSRQAFSLKVRLKNGYYEWEFHYELWKAVSGVST